MQPLCTSRSRRRLRRADALRATIDGTEFLLRVFAAEVDSSTRLEVWELHQPVDREKVLPGFELIESSLRVSPE
jgi:hypothetical protein